MKILIQNGKVYDPANGIDGKVKNIFIKDGTIVDEFSDADKTIDARDKSVMSGGIDIQSHVGTFGLNLARFTHSYFKPKDIGHIYAKMGYTFVNESLMTIETSNYVHHELCSIPIVDTSAFLALNFHDLWRYIKDERIRDTEDIISRLAYINRAIGVRICYPYLKFNRIWHSHKNISTKKFLKFFSQFKKDNLSFPVFLNTSPELLDQPLEECGLFHFSQLGSGITNEEQYNIAHGLLKKGFTADPGLHNNNRNKLIIDFEKSNKERCLSIGIALTDPICFLSGNSSTKEGKYSYYPLKLTLEADPSKICFSIRCNDGASFDMYPSFFSLLMSREMRSGQIEGELPHREFSLYEIAQITRSTPAKLLGLKNKGHLGTGADADISIYNISKVTDSKDLEDEFRNCSYLIKGGQLVIDDKRIIDDSVKKRNYYRKGLGINDKIENIYKISSRRLEHLEVNEIFIPDGFSV